MELTRASRIHSRNAFVLSKFNRAVRWTTSRIFLADHELFRVRGCAQLEALMPIGSRFDAGTLLSPLAGE